MKLFLTSWIIMRVKKVNQIWMNFMKISNTILKLQPAMYWHQNVALHIKWLVKQWILLHVKQIVSPHHTWLVDCRLHINLIFKLANCVAEAETFTRAKKQFVSILQNVLVFNSGLWYEYTKNFNNSYWGWYFYHQMLFQRIMCSRKKQFVSIINYSVRYLFTFQNVLVFNGGVCTR